MNINTPDDFDAENRPECQGIEEVVKRFENIMLSRIYVQQRLGNRLKNSIRIGMLILFLLAISIFTLLITLSIQVNRVGDSIIHMNQNFTGISENMHYIDRYMLRMEQQVGYLPKIKNKTAMLDQQVKLMNDDFSLIRNEMSQMSGTMALMERKIKEVSHTVIQLDEQIGLMNRDTYRMSKPAKKMNNLFPF
jgi:uncharacterized protein YoxC